MDKFLLAVVRDSRLSNFREAGAVQFFCRQTTPACSEDVSKQRASASLPDSGPIEFEEERAAREEDAMAALDAVGDYKAYATVMLEGASRHCLLQDSEGVVCMCCYVCVVCVCACVAVLVLCVCARARDVECVRENLYLPFLNFVCVCVCNLHAALR